MSDNKTTQTAEAPEIKLFYGPGEYEEYKEAYNHLNAVHCHIIPTIKKEAGESDINDIFISEGPGNWPSIYQIIRKTNFYIIATPLTAGYRTRFDDLFIYTYVNGYYRDANNTKRIKKTTKLHFINSDADKINIEIYDADKFKIKNLELTYDIFEEFKEFFKVYGCLLPYYPFRDYEDILRYYDNTFHKQQLKKMKYNLTFINGITKDLNVNNINKMKMKARLIPDKCRAYEGLNFMYAVFDEILKEAQIQQFLQYTTANPLEVDLTRMPN
jgi:hypothetical protein